ncbi:MAG: preprotein translocase subunit SecG [Clostridia bacterium]|nr:preprotein translocase subunit SecG [Clostridia bacterium]
MAILNGFVTVLLVITALILIVTVLLQPGEQSGLGAIAGGAETFFGKNKAQTMEGKLALATKVSAGVFIICALIVAVLG